MYVIRDSEDILLNQGNSEFIIDTERDIELSFRSNGKSDVFIRINKAGKIVIRGFIDNEDCVSLLFWNSSDSNLTIDESYNIMTNSQINISYGECNDFNITRNTYVALLNEGAKACISSASLVNAKKSYKMNIVNFNRDTYGEIKNYAVVLGNGELFIDAIGKIVKGAIYAKSHQTSRALCFKDTKAARLIPELLIDENNVQASHAMSVGRIDEAQLYYMQARGLSIEQCVTLISKGYLIPIVESISDEKLKEVLIEELNNKINEVNFREEVKNG